MIGFSKTSFSLRGIWGNGHKRYGFFFAVIRGTCGGAVALEQGESTDILNNP